MGAPLNKRQLTISMVIGFLIGLPLAGMLAGFIAWASLQRRSAELAGDFGLTEAVIVTKHVPAGEPLDLGNLAKRPVPRLVTSPNTVAPDEAESLRGKPPLIGFEPGDLLLRTAFGLEPRAAPVQEE